MRGAAMQCNDLDQLRTKSPSSKASTWPMEAQEHLASCSRCSQLQAVLKSSNPAEFPAALQSRIEAAILPGLKRVSPLPGAWQITAILLFCAAAVVAGANWQLGIAGWLARSRLQVFVDFTLLGISILVVAFALAKQMAPGSQHVGARVDFHRHAVAGAARGGGPIVWIPLESQFLAAGSFLLGNRGCLRRTFRAALLAGITPGLLSKSSESRGDDRASGRICRRHGAGNPLSQS